MANDELQNPARRGFFKKAGRAGAGVVASRVVPPSPPNPLMEVNATMDLLSRLIGDPIKDHVLGFDSLFSPFETIASKDLSGNVGQLFAGDISADTIDFRALDQLMEVHNTLAFVGGGIPEGLRFSHLRNGDRLEQVLKAKGVSDSARPAMIARCREMAETASHLFPGDPTMQELGDAIQDRLIPAAEVIVNNPQIIPKGDTGIKDLLLRLQDEVESRGGQNKLADALEALQRKIEEQVSELMEEEHKLAAKEVKNSSIVRIECTVDKLDAKDGRQVYSIRPVDTGLLTKMHLQKYCDHVLVGKKDIKRGDTLTFVEGMGQKAHADNWVDTQAQGRIETKNGDLIDVLDRAAENDRPIYLPALSRGVQAHEKHAKRLRMYAEADPIPVERGR